MSRPLFAIIASALLSLACDPPIPACAAGETLCGTTCVDLAADPAHCGACEVRCQERAVCSAGACLACPSGECGRSQLVAACYWTGQVAAIDVQSERRGPLRQVGTHPAALAAREGTLLVADGTDARLYQATLPETPDAPLEILAGAEPLGGAPNQVVLGDEHAYVVNALGGTLQVLALTEPSGDGPDGLAPHTVGQLNFGENAFPEGIARVDRTLFVPLFGGAGPEAAAAGQKVAVVSVEDPRAPATRALVDLGSLDLKAFPGAAPVPRPYAIAAHRGLVYVALNNLDPTTYAPGGPGLLAVFTPGELVPRVIDLGADRCLNPVWLLSHGPRLFVSCAGAGQYDAGGTLTGIRGAGVLMLEEDTVLDAVSLACLDGATACAPVQPGRLAGVGDRVFVADQNGGRVFVLELSGDRLAQRRSYRGSAGPPLEVCPPGAAGFANVSDLLAVP